MKVIVTWGWIPLVGLVLVAWGFWGAPRSAPTEIFSDGALISLLGAAVFIAGAVLTAVHYTREQQRIRDLRHRGL